MKRILMPVLTAAMLSAPAAYGAVIIVYDGELGKQFETEREIVEIVKEEYGDTAVYSTGDELPEGLDEALNPAQKLPDVPEVEDVPEALKDKLPHTEEGTRWVKVGDHLVEVDADDMIVMTIYDVLP